MEILVGLLGAAAVVIAALLGIVGNMMRNNKKNNPGHEVKMLLALQRIEAKLDELLRR